MVGTSVAVLDLVGSEPFWLDLDPINCPDSEVTMHKTRKKYFYFIYIFKKYNQKIRNKTQQIVNTTKPSEFSFKKF